MHIRMVWGRLMRGKWAEYEQYFNERVLGSANPTVEGLRGRKLLRSSENPDEGISLSLWDSLEAMQKYEKSPQRQKSVKATEHLHVGDYWVKKFEVRLSSDSD